MDEVSIYPEFTENGVSVQIDVERWLVRDMGDYSVGILSDGHLVVVDYSGAFSGFYEYEDFEAFVEGKDSPLQIERNSVIRAVAHALGITHVKNGRGKTVAVGDYFRDNEFDRAAGEVA